MKKTTKAKFFYIFTFGIGYLRAKKLAQSIQSSSSDSIKYSKNSNFDVDSLLSALGGVENISSVIPTISNLKIECKDKTLINEERLNTQKVKGFFLSQNKVTLLIGDISYDIADDINKRIGNNKG